MKETLTRLLSGIVYIVLLIAATSYSYHTFLLLFGVFLVLCVIEFCALVNLKKTLPLIIGLAGFVLFSCFHTSQITQLLLLVAALFASVKCLLFLFNDNRQQTDNISKYVYLIGYIIVPFVLMTKIPLGKIGYNPKIIISIFILIWTNDTFAYIVGRSFGKTKLLEKISPKKTIEGFAGGVIFALIAAVLLANYFVQQPIWIWLVTAFIVTVFGTLGDLVESKFKRVAGVKDSGSVMPGHGGILDRLDSVIFAVPVIYLFYQIVHYVS